MYQNKDIVRFKGGLGNQMFQYAFLESLREQHRDVYASLGFYNKNSATRPFCLKKIFPNLSIKEISDNIFDEIDLKWKKIKNDEESKISFEKNYSERFFWVESKNEELHFVPEVYLTKACAFVGYWQSYLYFKDFQSKITEDFVFLPTKELELFCDELKNYTSIHIRRGDYLYENGGGGDICPLKYYISAIKLIEDRYGKTNYLIVSDDLAWAKENLGFINDALFVSSDIFSEYDDWYDMYIMTQCRNNIIANSSFSWWGAYLNKNPDKIVVAPLKWFHWCQNDDLCPPEWIRI